MNQQPPPPPSLNADGLPVGQVLRAGWEISPRQTRDALAHSGPSRPLLLDCRRDDELPRARIAGSTHIPMDQIERRADELESDDGRRDHPIIVHCHHGVRSLRVATTLRALGFSNVLSMAGGIDLWSIDIDKSVPRY